MMATEVVSRLGLAHDFRCGHRLTFPCSKLIAGFRHGGSHTLSPAFGDTTVQYSGEFRLVVGIELLNSIEGIGKRGRVTHKVS